MIETILKYNFLQNAIMAAVLASIACGVIGVYIMEKKLVMMSGGIAIPHLAVSDWAISSKLNRFLRRLACR